MLSEEAILELVAAAIKAHTERIRKLETEMAVLKRALGWKLDPDGLNLVHVERHRWGRLGSFSANWPTVEDITPDERKALEGGEG